MPGKFGRIVVARIQTRGDFDFHSSESASARRRYRLLRNRTDDFSQALSRAIASHNARIWSSLCAAVTVTRNRADPFATVG